MKATAKNSTKKPAATSKPAAQDSKSPADSGILERVKAFVNLKFTPTIDELAYMKDPKEIAQVENVQMQEMLEFFLGSMNYEKAVHFLQESF